MRWFILILVKQAILVTLGSIIVFNSNNIFCQPNLPPQMRAAVYRIQQPKIKEGTAILFEEGKFHFLITARHALRTETGGICDSVFIFLNRITKTGEVVSGPEKKTVYLEIKGVKYYFLPQDTSIDLALIEVSLRNSTFTKEEKPTSVNTSILLSNQDLNRILNKQSVFTAIGYPQKGMFLAERTPEYRWGDFLGREGSFLKFNIPVLHGNSGSPTIVRVNDRYFFVGIMARLDTSRNISYAIPQSAIKDNFQLLFEVIGRLKDAP